MRQELRVTDRGNTIVIEASAAENVRIVLRTDGANVEIEGRENYVELRGEDNHLSTSGEVIREMKRNSWPEP